MIEAKVRNALALDYPRELLEVIVASDGSADRTVELARDGRRRPRARARARRQGAGPERRRRAGARRAARVQRRERDLGARRPARAGRAVRRPAGSATSAARRGCSTRAAPTRRASTGATSWRSASSSRGWPASRPATGRSTPSAARPTSPLGPAASHDLSFPFMLTKRGWRAVYAPAAVAEEKMVATIEGEFARKRRMMRGVFDEVVRDGMLAPRGYGPTYAFEIASHRLLRYASPFLHLIALAANARAARRRDRSTRSPSPLQLALLAAAALAGPGPARPLRIARYYVAGHRLDRRRALGPDAPRDAGRVGEGGGDAVSARRCRRVARPARCASRGSSPGRLAARCWRSRRSRSSSTPAAR